MESPRDISRLFSSAEETTQPERVPIKGEIPKWLKGSLYQTGPGLLDLPNFTLNDFQDGYAILTKFEIAGTEVKLEKKYPKSESYTKALEMGKPFFMEYGTTAKREGNKGGFFSKVMTTFSRDDMSDNCSANIYRISQTLIASSATTFFSKIHPGNLSIEQRYDAKKYLGQNGYGCHPLVDEDDTMWNMGFSIIPMVKYNVVKIPRAESSDLEVEEILSKGTTVASISPRWNGALAFNHSFGMSKNFIIFCEQPYAIKISRVLAASIKDLPVKDWLEWRGSEKNRFFIIEKATGKVISTEYYSAESFFFLHFINCYELGNKIIVDIAASKTPSATGATSLAKVRQNMIDEVDPFVIERFIIPVGDNVKNFPENSNLVEDTFPNYNDAKAIRKGNTVTLTPEVIFTRGSERTSINPKYLGKKYQYIFTSGSFLSLPDSQNSVMAHSICKVNTETKETKVWSATNDLFAGESILVPRDEAEAEDDDGILITPLSSSTSNGQSSLVFLDAKTMDELGRANFANHIPVGMHGIFLKN